MDNKRTELVFILDKSGSMGGLETDTIGGFNGMLKKQQGLEGECRMTTVLFASHSKLLHDRIDIRAVNPISEKEYQTGGNTALMDAIGEAIEKVDAAQAQTAQAYRAERVLFVIITDGMENASRRFTAGQIKQLISQRRADGWEFIFLGANIDAVETAAAYGIDTRAAVDYVPDKQGTQLNYAIMSETVSHFRSAPVAGLDESALDAIRADMKKRGRK